MNDRQLARRLQTIAEEIPEMDALDAVRGRIVVRQRVHKRRARLLIALALLILSLLGAVVGYALYQSNLDPGLQSVEDAGMLNDLNLSQTENGVTFSITKGYADENRVALWYTLTGLDDDTREHLYINPGIFHADRDEWFGTGAMSGYPLETDDSETLAGIVTFDHAEPAPVSGLYDLRLNVRIERFSDQVGDVTEPNKVVAAFSFDFQLPAVEALALEPQQSVTSNGVEMTLETLRISPSQTALVLCFDMPSAQDWQPDVRLTIDDQVALPSGWGTVGGKSWTLDSPRRCLDMTFIVPYSDEAQRLVLEVDGLQTSAPEATEAILAEAAERLAEQGIVVKFHMEGHGMGWDVISAPDDLSETEVNMAIWDSMREQYAGEWRFEVELP